MKQKDIQCSEHLGWKEAKIVVEHVQGLPLTRKASDLPTPVLKATPFVCQQCGAVRSPIWSKQDDGITLCLKCSKRTEMGQQD